MGDAREKQAAAARARRLLRGTAALGLVLAVAACGGRSSNPTAVRSDLDSRLSCAHLSAEKTANLRRMEDLRDERNENRIRSVARLPGAIIGNPISAIVLADPSIAVYEEIGALERRNIRIDELTAQKACGEQKGDARSAAVAPLDDIDPALYEAQYDVDEPVDEALSQPQPEIAPKQVSTEQAQTVAEPVVQAGERDEAAAAVAPDPVTGAPQPDAPRP